MVDLNLAQPKSPPGSVSLLGVRVHSISFPDLLKFIQETIDKNSRSIIANANASALNLAYELPWFRGFLNNCEVVFCDGFGVKLGAKILGVDRLYRYTPPDWLPGLFTMCTRSGYSIYLLGAKPGIAQKAAENIKKQHPGLTIAGINHGYFDKTCECDENKAVVQNINETHPHILLIGFGMPLQERWLLENWDEVKAIAALPVGAAIDYMAGVVPRAPRWMTDHGLEWLGRLLIEPGRLWKRYLIGNPLFIWRIIKQKMGILQF